MDKSTFEALFAGREFADGLHEGIWVAEGSGKVVFANRSMVALLGQEDTADIVGRAWQDLFNCTEPLELKDAAAAGRSSWCFESCRVRGTNNKETPVRVEVTRRTRDGVPWLIGSVITTSKSARLSGLTDSTGRQVMENAVDGICIVEEKRVVYVNRRFEELTGYTRSQLGMLSLDKLVSPRDRQAVTQVTDAPDKVLTPVHHEVRVVTRSGRELDCELRIVPTESSAGTALLCFLRDISQLRRAERSRTDFIGMVSHELRTPLAAIKEAMSLLSESASAQLKDRELRYLGIAREEMDRLNRMITNLVEVSRMEADKFSLKLEPIALEDILARSLESLTLLINKKNLKVEKRVQERLPKVLGDQDRLLQVFNNILDNAIKYTPPSSTIRATVRHRGPMSDVLALVGLSGGGGYIQASIEDSGPGIPAEFLDRIFGKFERVDPHGPGIGLGLSIVQSIIELHNGKVWASSVLGEGTAFNILLPVKED
jgi:two-component system sensor histidine kinase VicK